MVWPDKQKTQKVVKKLIITKLQTKQKMFTIKYDSNSVEVFHVKKFIKPVNVYLCQKERQKSH